jgi:transposase
MAEASKQGELFDAGAAGATTTTTISVNARCVLRTEHGCRVVFVAGLPMAHFAVGDRMASAYAMVTIVEHGWADQNEVARAFECSARTVRRTQRRFEKGGLAALGRGAGYPKGRARLRGARSRRVHDLKAQGQSNRAIAARLGVTEKAVRKLLRRLGWKPPEPEQRELPLGPAGRMGADPNLSASATTPSPISTQEPEKTTAAPVAVAPSRPETPSAGADPNLAASVTDVPASTDAIEEPLPITFDTDPADRHQDRLYAHLGLLADAMPMFREGSRIPRAGVLLAMPALLDTGVLDCARDIYGSIGPAFYGLRTSIVAMLVMALLRIKRPEALKEQSPAELGRLLGLDRAPEVKTLRRKLTRLSVVGRATDFGRALATRRVAARGQALGFLYVVTCACTTANAPCRRPTSRRGICRCRPRPTTGSTTPGAIRSSSSRPRPTPVSSRCCPPCLTRCESSSANVASRSCSIAADGVRVCSRRSSRRASTSSPTARDASGA